MLTLLPWSVYAYTVAIAGVHGGLGRELAQQSVLRGWDVVALVRPYEIDRPILQPFRNGWLGGDETTPLLEHGDRLRVVRLDEPCCFDALVLAMGASALQADTSHESTAAILQNLPAACQKVTLVSAYGTNDEFDPSNIGIRIMRDWYLRDVYESKRIQEELVEGLENVTVEILRPKVLSYGPIPFNTIHTTREALARRILGSTDAASPTVSDRAE